MRSLCLVAARSQPALGRGDRRQLAMCSDVTMALPPDGREMLTPHTGQVTVGACGTATSYRGLMA
jgi:hypothetical protein